ncbi:hypothetical protein [Desulfoluna sp.]|uniref:hypothetical protein n=1 Tax=Desulfoluna sp. TaxID=2045199 RepID=UPI002623F6FD|nr:hypothetical protein [Desulfoluna sp.]
MKQWILVVGLLVLATACARPPQYVPSKKPARINYETAVDGQISTLSTQVAKQLTRRRIRRVAVKEFTRIDGKRKQLEKYLEMEVSDKLFKTGYFTVVRSEVLEDQGEDSVLGLVESAVTKNSKIKEEDARKVGRALNIDAIVVGHTVVLGNAVKLSIQLISTSTGSVFGSASTLLSKDRNIRTLLDEKAAGKEASLGRNGEYGEFINTGENQYHELVSDLYTLYVKQVNNHMDLFSETGPTVEVFLNDEYKVLGIDEMVTFNLDEKTYVLTLRKISGRKAVFSFAKLRNASDDEEDNAAPPQP